jgi:hypothetical protein
MNSLFFVVCIVAIVFSAGVLKEYLKMKATNKEGAGDSDETLAELERLEERIRVLERIVTEKKFDLRNEIDRL